MKQELEKKFRGQAIQHMANVLHCPVDAVNKDGWLDDFEFYEIDLLARTFEEFRDKKEPGYGIVKEFVREKRLREKEVSE